MILSILRNVTLYVLQLLPVINFSALRVAFIAIRPKCFHKVNLPRSYVVILPLEDFGQVLTQNE